MTEAPPTEGGKQEHPLAWVRINLAYFRTPSGSLKILQLVSHDIPYLYRLVLSAYGCDKFRARYLPVYRLC
ncbi:unnamed protein product [Nezara viridula]|uniref:Uncharacterized protein n=1 Tax=Nezara viridula TaxID=85310 RepID=A0A9P0MPB3_NEZVI|nr:unnamed protein product [Nezara viridula]